MRVFVTAATGWVGSAVVADLIASGHQVLGLTRLDEGARVLAAAGAEVHRGDVGDVESLKRGAAEADGVIHTAFNHDFSRFMENCEEDRRAIEAMGAVLEGSERPLLVSSGVAYLAPGHLATEADSPPPELAAAFPRKSEVVAKALAERGVRAASVRLAPSVHGHGDHGFVPRVIQFAREKGVSPYIQDGMNRWPGVHRRDAARVYRLALEAGAAAGTYHAVAEEGVPFKAIAEVIGRRLGVPVVSMTAEVAAEHFDWFMRFAAIDAPTSSARTREDLGWKPEGQGLLQDVDDPAYFAG